MAKEIFISYSRRDTAIVDKVADTLIANGFSVWVDRDGVESGDAFKKKIVEAIADAKVVVFFSSESSNNSPWTLKEIGVAVARNKKIIPVKLDSCNYNSALEFDLVDLDFIDYTIVENREEAIKKLIRSLTLQCGERKQSEQVEAQHPAAEQTPAAKTEKRETLAPPRGKKVNKKKLAIILGTVIAVAGVVAGIWVPIYSGCFDYYESGAVDLGLSVKWASCNVGATSPEQCGNYYAWGETEPKNVYSEENYTFTDNPETLPLMNDAANMELGGSWRMPTKKEFEELINNCSWKRRKYNGIKGFKVESRTTDKSIFIPSTGYWKGDFFWGGVGRSGRYWSSSSHQENARYAWYLTILYKSASTSDFYAYRDYGCSIRPVTE